MRAADDAVLVETDGMDHQQVVDALVQLVVSRGGKACP